MLPANRPESWNAKMPISGEPLITDKQFEKLLANAPTSLVAEMRQHDPVPVVKIFLPHVRWVLAWIDPDDFDRVYGVMKWGNEKPEEGEFSLSDIVNSSLGGIVRPERDKYITLDQPLSHYLRNDADAW